MPTQLSIGCVFRCSNLRGYVAVCFHAMRSAYTFMRCELKHKKSGVDSRIKMGYKYLFYVLYKMCAIFATGCGWQCNLYDGRLWCYLWIQRKQRYTAMLLVVSPDLVVVGETLCKGAALCFCLESDEHHTKRIYARSVKSSENRESYTIKTR